MKKTERNDLSVSNFLTNTLKPSNIIITIGVESVLGYLTSRILLYINALDSQTTKYILISSICIFTLIVVLMHHYTNYVKEKFSILQNDYDTMNTKLENFVDSENKKITKADKIFYIALALDNYEPSKYVLLEEAANKGSYHAGLYLSNAYSTGIHKENRTILNQDRQKQFDILTSIADIDPSGCAYWELGWLCEQGLVGSDLDKLDREKRALEYYDCSANKNFAKAFNSIGKFYQFGMGGKAKDIVKAIPLFAKANNLGDVNGILNEASAEIDHKNFKRAKELLEDAVKIKNTNAYTKLADFLHEHPEMCGNEYTMDCIVNLYLEAYKLTEGNFAAIAAFKLGNLIENNNLSIEQIREVQKAINIEHNDNVVLKCYQCSNKIFTTNEKNGIKFTNGEKVLYEKVKKYQV